MSFLGLWCSKTCLTNALPNEPVPPVTKIDFPDRSTLGASKDLINSVKFLALTHYSTRYLSMLLTSP